MTRAAWNEIARELGRLRAKVLEHAARSSAQRSANLERAQGVELAARAICAALRRRSARFDGRRFMQIVRAPTK